MRALWLVSIAAMIAALISARTAHSQSAGPHFDVSVRGGLFPIISGTTDLPDGTVLFVNVRKPWLPDGAQRVARGIPACGDDCIPAEVGENHLIGATVTVRN